MENQENRNAINLPCLSSRFMLDFINSLEKRND
jgi:hypothetical protein